ncbi:Retrotransposable element Tf2 protein [Rhizoctonia solani]|uniref:Retrotransposable element Tf2 protein n=1 Tax=Rhizoctonia solani TaxID=456999 RepID=A0A8H8P7M0_9AGAM|nr:Retrotransposable element Tf2 protein [Rhizoctonia solani]QRW26675.1 Retrotransposable element Tf2 protein [Rhizoctonia solani]
MRDPRECLARESKLSNQEKADIVKYAKLVQIEELTRPSEGGPKTAEVPDLERIPSEQLLEEVQFLEHLTREQRLKLEAIVRKNELAFGLNGRLGNYDAQVEIKLRPGTKEISLAPYSASPAKREVIDKQIKEWLRLEVIEPSKSAWGFPVIVVYRNSKPRVCIDYQRLNAVSIPDEYPLPKQTDILHALKGAQWLSTLDALAGFTQLSIKEEDQDKTAFRCHQGLFNFKRLPFGYRNGTSLPHAVSNIPSTRSGVPHPYSRPTSRSSRRSIPTNSQPASRSASPTLRDLPRMEPEPSPSALLKAITALTATVGSLQDQIRAQSQQIVELRAICRETADLLGDKDQGAAQAKPGPSTGPVTPPTHSGGEAHTPGTVRPGLKAPFRPSRGTGFDSEEEEEPRRPKKEPQGTPRRHLGSLTPFDAGSSVKRPKMDLPDPYKGDTRGRKATQWLDRMMLWVALHRDQFDEEEQMVVWILYHMTDKAADWALPIIGAIIKGEGNPPTTIQALTGKFKEAFDDPDAKRAAARKIAALSQTTTTSEYVTEFRNLMAELDWNEEAYIAQFTRGLHWKVKELLSTKDSVPDELEAIFAASIKIDNICRKNKENRPKKAPAKSPATVATTSTTTTQRVRLSEDPNYVTPEERDRRRASGLCVKCGQKGHGIKQCPNGWKATIKEVAKPSTPKRDIVDTCVEFVSVGLDSNKKPLLFINLHVQNSQADPIKTLIDSGATSNFISPSVVEKLKIPKTQLENPRVVRMLDGTISQTGRIWHQVQLTVLANGHTHSIPFLVCPIGNTPAILGMTWLTAEAPLIDWQQGLITFPDQVQIASEEEADPNSLANLPEQYHEFAKVFGEEEFKVLPPHREYNIAIDLVPDAKLSPGPIYGMTDAESKALKQHIDEELATGKIRPSTSSAGAPVMFVKKANGSLRLVVDYRKLNDVTQKNLYPLPRQDDLMAKLRHAKIFTKLDLRWGYNNVRIKEGDEWKTAFRTKYGLFEYLVMPFGLTNAPAAFQHFMNDLFRDLIDVTVVIYLDDILIFSEKPEDHPIHVREVLSRLMKNQLFCKLTKCYFHVTTVDYLGIVISPAGFSMDQKKIEAVTSWPQPKTVKQVQAFLGFVNYLRRFIPNFSSVARPLHNLTKKETPWSWGNLEESAFQELKSLVTKSPVLIHSNPALPYYLETDASGVAMGAILSQRGPDNRLHPIAYMSKSFSGAEANYDTHDKELLAIIKALEEWRIFLEATDKPVQVFTDHRNLDDFNFEIHYRPGKQSGKPDALSRRSDYVDTPPEPEVMLPEEVFANTSKEEVEIVTEIRSRLREDPSLEPIIQFLTEDVDNAPPPFGKLTGITTGKKTYYDSEVLKEQLLREFHDSPLAGHPGQQRTLELLSRNYWWPGMKSSAKEWVECCPTCQANRRAHAPVITLKPLEVPPYPFHTISYDFITGFPKSNGHDAILVVIDSFSKFGHFIPTTKKVTSKGLADLFISQVWKLHGLPVRTISDRGTTFTGKFLRALYQRLGVKPSFSSAYHLESDGQTERVNQFIEFYLRSYVAADHSDWASWLPLAEYAYNNARHSATGKTPFELVYGQNPVMNPSNVPANFQKQTK